MLFLFCARDKMRYAPYRNENLERWSGIVFTAITLVRPISTSYLVVLLRLHQALHTIPGSFISIWSVYMVYDLSYVRTSLLHTVSVKILRRFCFGRIFPKGVRIKPFGTKMGLISNHSTFANKRVKRILPIQGSLVPVGESCHIYMFTCHFIFGVGLPLICFRSFSNFGLWSSWGEYNSLSFCLFT